MMLTLTGGFLRHIYMLPTRALVIQAVHPDSALNVCLDMLLLFLKRENDGAFKEFPSQRRLTRRI